MKVFYSNLFKNYFFLTLTLFVSEIIFRLVTGLSIIDWSILRIFVGINVISLLVSVIGALLGRIGGNILTFIVSAVTAIYAVGQAGFYNYLGVYVSFGTSSQVGAVKEYIGDYFNSFKWSFWLVFVPSLLLLFFYIFIDPKIKLMQRNETIDFSDKFDDEERKKINTLNRKRREKRAFISGIVSSFVFIGVFIGVWYSTLIIPMFQNKLQLTSTKSLFDNPSIPNIAMSQFGYNGYLFVDVKALLLPSNVQEKTEYDNKYVLAEQVDSDFTRYEEDGIISNTDWTTIIENEKNSNYRKLSNYYISQEITDKNDYTGIFKDKNLIIIMMESTNNILINREYYPNVYKLYSEGWAWDNSYSPRNACSTGNNEMSGMISLFTINNSCTANNYKNNVYPESIFNLFNNAGYQTSSYHNYTDQYYFRTTIHPNMGSGKYYGVQALGIPYQNVYQEWPSDVELVNKVLEITESQDKYMLWLTSVSAHQPYTQDSTLGRKHLDLFKDTNYNVSLKRYMSKLKEFDLAIGALLDGLEAQGKLDNTVILLYADHYPYGLNNATLEGYFNTKLTVNNEIDKTPFIIYSPGIQARRFDTYTSFMNITPTVANLFDLKYDPRIYAGHDIFDTEYENRVIFADGSWKDDKAFYEATNGRISYTDNNNKYTDQELSEINNSVKNRITMSNLAIRTNYFKYLYGKFDELHANDVKEVESATEENQEEIIEEDTNS